ncbi:MAG TPA: hypothetical protein VG389_17210 [Myxococcota bacterium]|jgi:hypothetical protein|nr:hypothetical protein [Myxococcota bacterium]
MRRAAAALYALALLFVVLLVPRAALACPACARDAGGPLKGVLLGAMIFFPFAVVGVVVRIIRNAQPSSPPPAEHN